MMVIVHLNYYYMYYTDNTYNFLFNMTNVINEN